MVNTLGSAITAVTVPNVRIALGSDERTALTDSVVEDLRGRGHEVVLVGPPAGDDLGWAEVGRRVGELVAGGETDTAVLCCWTGTGASIAANKVAGVRAALCTDAETARGRPALERRQRPGAEPAAGEPAGGVRRCSTPGSPPAPTPPRRRRSPRSTRRAEPPGLVPSPTMAPAAAVSTKGRPRAVKARRPGAPKLHVEQGCFEAGAQLGVRDRRGRPRRLGRPGHASAPWSSARPRSGSRRCATPRS